MMRSCFVAGCLKQARSTVWGTKQFSSNYCSMHARRKQRLGSPTARRCLRCWNVTDDADTAELEGKGGFICRACLLREEI